MKKVEKQTLSLYPIDYPFETLVSRVESEPAKLILNPEFQRKYKWDEDGHERGSRFIESCLMRIPIPACYFSEKQDNRHEVIDGVQRITTIQRFFNDEFALEGLTIYEELNGKKFSELGILMRGELENTTIRCIILRKENPKGLISEIFSRLNQGAVKLSDQEIRHAIYAGELNNLLIELGNHEFIAEFKNKKDKNGKQKEDRQNEELVLRYFALNNNLDDYKSKLKKYLDKYTIENQNITTEKVKVLKDDFLKTLDKCIRTFEKPFVNASSIKQKEGLVYYDLLMWSFNELSDDFIDEKKEEINTKYFELCAMEEFAKTLSGGTQSKTSILLRRQLWTNKLKEIDGYNESL